MSWLSSGIKKIGRAVGKGLGAVSGFIPGPLDDIAASVLQGGNMKDHLVAGAGGMIPGVGGGLLKKIGGFAGGTLGKLVPDALERGVGGGLKKLGGLGLDDILAGVEGARGAHDLFQSYKQRNRALGSAEDAYNERAGLRRMGVQGMMDDTAPDLSGVFADEFNPYRQPQTPQARGLRRIGGY